MSEYVLTPQGSDLWFHGTAQYTWDVPQPMSAISSRFNQALFFSSSPYIARRFRNERLHDDEGAIISARIRNGRFLSPSSIFASGTFTGVEDSDLTPEGVRLREHMLNSARMQPSALRRLLRKYSTLSWETFASNMSPHIDYSDLKALGYDGWFEAEEPDGPVNLAVMYPERDVEVVEVELNESPSAFEDANFRTWKALASPSTVWFRATTGSFDSDSPFDLYPSAALADYHARRGRETPVMLAEYVIPDPSSIHNPVEFFDCAMDRVYTAFCENDERFFNDPSVYSSEGLAMLRAHGPAALRNSYDIRAGFRAPTTSTFPITVMTGAELCNREPIDYILQLPVHLRVRDPLAARLTRTYPSQFRPNPTPRSTTTRQ